jgi:hypothetical protein
MTPEPKLKSSCILLAYYQSTLQSSAEFSYGKVQQNGADE